MMIQKINQAIRDRFIKKNIFSNDRSVSYRYLYRGKYHYLKEFDAQSIDSMDSFSCELEARDLFNDKTWIIPIIARHKTSFITRYYESSKYRLDLVSDKFSQKEKIDIAHRAIIILFDIFLAGYAHRDAHAGNFLYYKRNLFLSDFETLIKIPPYEMPPFPLSYDLIGKGLESPYKTYNMCYQKDHNKSLQSVLNEPLEEVLSLLINDLKVELLNSSVSFQTKGRRIECNAQRIYTSFDLPFFKISSNEAQRDSNLRFSKFGITEETLKGKTLLDLGCNSGGMIFASHKFSPKFSCGFEIDFDKVAIAKKIAAFNGLNSIKFYQANIDELIVNQKFDVVYCLAIEAHVENKKRLYEILGNVTNEVLFFEGNSTTNKDEVIKNLKACGFSQVLFLGFCDDDCQPENNIRPLFVARK